ncbi:hypothetical protein SAMN05720761_11354 [Fibrobacter sp. UWCM]|uniref:hypothetical protein n=1 Tax=Fibrobacter sp. UWCM TaxID=1896208 RepID=UPI000914F3BB|nr:hypothetical protein [Fibrobacter sp. UWCM]SHH36464.1 hypothetical protein SAMN05720761_11354 [Fibrobacter sp. UWCM]
MKVSIGKSLFAFACIFAAFLLVACTSDLSPEAIAPDGFTYSQDEYDSLVASGKMDKTGHVIKSSAATKQSSSSVATSSETGGSSSSEEGSSSSGAEDASSSSEDDDWIESSSSAEPESSSAYEATFGENKSIVAKEGVLSIGVDAFADVDDEYAEELEQVKASIEDSEKQAPEGYSDFGLESTTSEFNYEAYIDNEFFCLDKEGNWSEISRAKLAEFIPHFKNGADLGPLDGFKVSFADACKAVFARKDAE